MTHTSGPPFATCGEFCQWIIDGNDVFTRDHLADRNAILSTPLRRARDLWKQCRRAIRIDDCPHCYEEPTITHDGIRHRIECEDCPAELYAIGDTELQATERWQKAIGDYTENIDPTPMYQWEVTEGVSWAERQDMSWKESKR